MTRFLSQAFAALTLVLVGFDSPAAAQSPEDGDWLCDTQYQDCREPILAHIRNELTLMRNEPTRAVGIDVGFWYMEDDRYVTELIRAHQGGVPIRVLVDQRGNKYRLNETMLNRLRDAGIPMRDKFGGDVLHWKMMFFHGQNTVQFSKANYNAWALAPQIPNVSYDDEAVVFSNDSRITNSFRARFDERWINTTLFRNYGNITAPLARRYSDVSIHSSMNFPPDQDFSVRSVSRYNAEMDRIDAIVFRVTDRNHANGMINAVARGVPVRLITEPSEYRNRARVWDAKHKDRMYMGGVQMKVRHRNRPGIVHQASVVMHGLREVIFGSSNWTSASALYSDEHNFFYNPRDFADKAWFFQWFADQFDRKWADTTNYEPFDPLPPDTPIYFSPANSATGQGSSVTLSWDGQEFAHYYDIYFGTTTSPPLLLSQTISDSTEQLGSPLTGQRESLTVSNLLPGTTYYWRIVGKTWANEVTSGPTWSFTTAGTAPGGGTTPPPSGGSSPYGGTAATVPGAFEAENFDAGGQNIAYYDSTTGNTGGAYRPSEHVDIQATSDVSGVYNVGWTKVGEWLQYTVNVGSTGSYRFEARVANSGAGGRFHVNVDGVDLTGAVTVPSTGGWQTWQTISTAAIPLTAGQRVIRVVFDAVSSTGSVGNFNWFRLVADGSTPSTPPPPPPTTTAYGGTPVALPGVLQAENFDVGAQNVAYYDASAGNSGGVYRTDTDVDIGTDPATGNYHIGWARVGEWVTYTVNVTESRFYDVSARLANLGSGATFRVEVDGVDRTGAIAVPNTGGWDVWQSVPLGNIALTQGLHVVRVVMVTRNVENSSVGNFDYFTFQ